MPNDRQGYNPELRFPMKNTAVLIIDMQNDYLRHEGLEDCKATLIEAINRLVFRARESSWPIIWVVSEFAADLSDAFPEMRHAGIKIVIEETEGAQLIEELDCSAEDYRIVKKRYSAFFNTELDRLLVKLDVERVILAGVNTHACVRTTAIDAYQRDIEVIIPQECVASYDSDHHDISLRYMGGKIAEVVPLAEIR